jgi:hypothetical protein
MRSIFNKLSQALGVLVLLLFSTIAHADGWRADPDDAQLFDVRLNQYRLGDGVRGYATPTGVCVDFADTILALDLAIRLDKESRRATGWAFFENHSVTIDRVSGLEQIVNTRQKVALDDIRDTPEGWCIAVNALSRWLGVELVADTSNALLLIKSDRKLPPQLIAERRARVATIPSRFDLASLPQARVPFHGIKMPAVDVVTSLASTRDRANGNRFDANYEVYAAGETGPVAYDARLSSDRTGLPSTLRLRAYRTDPAGNLPLGATHIAAGDVQGYATPLVSQTGVGRGFVATNRPVDRPQQFDRTDFRGELPRGWDVELYRNGQLLGFANDRSDGRYEFLDVPLQYGQNRFEIVLYGPQGQIRRDVRSVPVGLDSIPPRQTFWWAGADDEGRDLIGLARAPASGRNGLRGTFGLERGLDARTSVAFTAQSLSLDAVARRNFGEVALRRAIGPMLGEASVAVDTQGGRAIRGQALGQLGEANIALETIWAGGGFQSDRLLRGITGLHRVSIDHFFGSGRTSVPVHFDARLTTRDDGSSVFDVNGRSSVALGRLSLTGDLAWRDERRRLGPETPGQLEAGLLANARIGPVRLRSEARWRLAPQRYFDSVMLVGEWAASKDGRRPADWRAEFGYSRNLARAHMGLRYIRRFDRFALSVDGEVATDGSVSTGLNLAFSLGPDPRRGRSLRVTAEKLAQQGSALVRVWRDTNGNGMRDAGEPSEKSAQITAGRVIIDALTDENGEVIVDGLEPFQPVLVGIDGSSLPDPFVQPSLPGKVVVPRPGIAAVIELPLVATGDIDGNLVRVGGGDLGGLALELVDSEGRVMARTTSEFDGFLLFEKVPYGRYSIRVTALAADAADVGTALVRGIIVSAESPSVHLGILSVAPKSMQQAERDVSGLRVPAAMASATSPVEPHPVPDLSPQSFVASAPVASAGVQINTNGRAARALRVTRAPAQLRSRSPVQRATLQSGTARSAKTLIACRKGCIMPRQCVRHANGAGRHCVKLRRGRLYAGFARALHRPALGKQYARFCNCVANSPRAPFTLSTRCARFMKVYRRHAHIRHRR